jgi:hypothetical protein
MLKIISVIGKGIRRAVTKDGGALFKLKDQFGKRDAIWVIAFGVRGLLFVCATALGIWFAKMAGIEPTEFFSLVGEFMQTVGASE